MNFKLDIKLPKVQTRKAITPKDVNRHKWGFLELFQETMGRDLRSGNPWLDEEARKQVIIRIKRRKKHVTFNLVPNIRFIPRISAEEKKADQDERLKMLNERLDLSELARAANNITLNLPELATANRALNLPKLVLIAKNRSLDLFKLAICDNERLSNYKSNIKGKIWLMLLIICRFVLL